MGNLIKGEGLGALCRVSQPCVSMMFQSYLIPDRACIQVDSHALKGTMLLHTIDRRCLGGWAYINKEGLCDRRRVSQPCGLDEDAIISGLALQQLGQDADQVASHCGFKSSVSVSSPHAHVGKHIDKGIAHIWAEGGRLC